MNSKRRSGKVIIGTRGSPLALAQANEVKEKIIKLNNLDPQKIDIKIIKTSGDKFLNTSLSKIGGKGLFTKEIQQALFDKEIDMAVHSMKDVETILPDELYISTILPREDITDSFSGKISVRDDKYVLYIEGQKIINDSKTVWTYLEDLNEVTISDFDASEQDISINNVFEVYKEGYKHKFIDKVNGINNVEIYPDDESKSYFKISFAILENNLLSSFTVYDKSNSIFIYTIDDFMEEDLDNSLFFFDLEKYPDIEVIDFR